MEAVREPEVIRLYREDEVVELVANYLLSNKKHEQERQRKQKVKQIVSRQRKRQLLRELLISFLKQIITRDIQYNNMVLSVIIHELYSP